MDEVELELELVELDPAPREVPSDDGGEDGPGGAGGARTGRGGPAGHGARRSRRPIARFTVVVVVLGAVVVANVAESRRAERTVAAVDQMSGLVGALGDPLDEVWELDRNLVTGTAGDLLITRDEGGLVAIDVVSGAQRWQVRGRDAVDLGGCHDVVGSTTPMVLCWRLGGGGADPAAGAGGVRSALVGLSLADGSVLLEREMDLPSAGYGVLDGDLVRGDLAGPVLAVERMDPVTGVVRWATEIGTRAQVQVMASVDVSHGLVVVRGPTTAVLRAADGELLGRWEQPVTSSLDGAAITTAPLGFGAWAPTSDGVLRSADGTWYPTGGEPVAIHGLLAEPEITDGSAPDVLLLWDQVSTILGATDVRTGEQLWTTNLVGGAVMMRRDGAVVVADVGRVAAFDLVTGAERWSRPVEGLRPDAGFVTDGWTVVVMAVRRGGRWMQAVGLDQGESRWEAPAPAPLQLFVLPTAADPASFRTVDGNVVVAVGSYLIGVA